MSVEDFVVKFTQRNYSVIFLNSVALCKVTLRLVKENPQWRLKELQSRSTTGWEQAFYNLLGSQANEGHCSVSLWIVEWIQVWISELRDCMIKRGWGIWQGVEIWTFIKIPSKGNKMAKIRSNSLILEGFISLSEYILVVNLSVKCLRVELDKDYIKCISSTSSFGFNIDRCITTEQLHYEFSLTTLFENEQLSIICQTSSNSQ